MLAAAALVALLTAGPALVAIPDEPGAQVLVEASIYQAVAADLDGDGGREIVVLTHGDGSVISASAWRETESGWRPVGAPIEVVPGATIPGIASLGSPIRLVVRHVDREERVTLVRQPAHGGEGDEESCCLLIDDLLLDSGGLRLVPAAAMRSAVEALHAVDLDGDGTDELVTTTSVPPLGDISYPTDVRVYRWSDDRFTVTDTRLTVGSGDTPFLLGDSDGRPGDELAIIATAGRPALYRLSLGAEDRVVVEDAGLVADDALAVPLDAGAGIALLAGDSLAVHPWPSGQALGPPTGQVPVGDATFLGTVTLDGTESVVARQISGGDRLHAFGLPELTPPRFGAITRSPAAAAFASGPVLPYVGPLPGGGPDGRPALVYGGRLLSSAAPPQMEPFSGVRIATMAGAQPIGIVGATGDQVALLHGDAGPQVDARGGRLDAPVLITPSGISVAPLALMLEPEREDAVLEPRIDGALAIGSRRTIAIGPGGFHATVVGPPGSRVYVGSEDPSVVESIVVLPESGTIEVPMAPAGVTTPSARYRASLGVTTPAGHSYLATWEVRVLDEAPALETSVSTRIGSGEVEVTGRSAQFATVSVDGSPVAVDGEGRFAVSVPAPPWPTAISVVATDPFGNVAERRLTGVGWFDYRGLPWIAIVVVGVAIAGSVLYVRVPRPRPMPRRADDDAAFEELELD
jgi:hypothetical protein